MNKGTCRFCRIKTNRKVKISYSTSHFVCSNCAMVLNELIKIQISRGVPYRIRKMENDMDKLRTEIRRLNGELKKLWGH